MTDHPSQPRHDDSNHLNTLLDALVAGKRAPDANGASDDDAFAATHVHRLVSGDAGADVSAIPTEHTLDTIWRNVMQAHAVSPGAEPEFMPPQSARQKARVRAVSDRPRPSRFQTLVSIGAVAAMLIVLIGAAWIGRGGGSTEPPGTERYAAQPLDQGTPESLASVWHTPVMPEDCVAERMDREEYFDIMRTGPTPAPRAYLPITSAERDVAIEVATAGRIREACLIYGDLDQWRTLETPSALYARTAGPPDMSPEEADELRQLSDHLPIVPFDELFTYTQERMPEKLATLIEGTHEAQIETGTYLPDYAYQLADGRIAVAIGTIFWANPEDEHFKVWVEEDPDTQATAYSVFTSVDGQWLYDQRIDVCVGECDEYWSQMSGEELATIASPAATPPPGGTVDDWTTYTTPEECVPRADYTEDESATIVSGPWDWPEREYGPYRDASPEQQGAAITTLRGFVGCEIMRDDDRGTVPTHKYFSERWVFDQLSDHPAAVPWNDPANVELGKDISSAYADYAPTDFFIVIPDGELAGSPTPSMDGNAASGATAFRPQHVIQLADGRLAVPLSLLYAESDPVFDIVDRESVPYWSSSVLIISEGDGVLQIDEMLPFCVGDCNDYWSELEATGPYASATPTAGWTAEAPLSPDAWMKPVTWEACTAEPMTFGEYVDIIQRDIDLSGRSYEMAGPPAPETTADALSAVRNYTACAFAPYGEYDEDLVRSLTTDAYIWETSNQVSGAEAAAHRAASPAYEELENHFLALPRSSSKTVLQSEAPQYVQDIWERRQELAATPDVRFGGSGEDFVYASGYPYGEDIFNPNLAVELDDGRIAIPMTTIYWAGDPDIAWIDETPYFSIVLYIMAENNGEWLLDEQLWICVEGCEPPATPAETPFATPGVFAPDVMIGDKAAVIRALPELSERGFAILPPGTPLMSIPADDGTTASIEEWAYVMTDDGRTGWVRVVDIELHAPNTLPVATPEG